MKFLSYFFLLISITSFSQNEVTNFFDATHWSNYNKAKQIINKITDNELKPVLEDHLNILLNGDIKKTNKNIELFKNRRARNIGMVNNALLTYVKEGNEEKAFTLLRETLKNAEKEQDTLIILLSVRYILEIYERFHITVNDVSHKYFLNLYSKYAEDTFHKQLHSLYEYRITQRYNFKDTVALKKIYIKNKGIVNKIKAPLFAAKRDITHFVHHLTLTKNNDSLFFYANRAEQKLKNVAGYFENECYIAAKINKASAEIERGNSKRALITLDSIKIPNSDYLFKNLESFIHFRKYVAYEKLGDTLNGLRWYNTYLTDALSSNQAKNLQLVSEYETKYQTAEKNKLLLLTDQQKERNRNIAIGLGGSLLGVVLIGFLLFVNTKKKQRIAEQQRELELQKTEKILKEQELNAIDAMIAGQEKERQRLAGDLHDSVGSTLAAAKLQFHHLSKNRDKGDEIIGELFQRTGALLDSAYAEVRSMAHVKNYGVIAKNGLLPAVQNLVKSASGVNGLEITVEDFGLEKRLDNALEISIFRIIQELVTNIMKHSNATRASVAINQYDDTFNLIVEDNGRGFDARHLPKKEGMGLSSIETRVEHLEGTMEIDSTIGKGTHILIDIPL